MFDLDKFTINSDIISEDYTYHLCDMIQPVSMIQLVEVLHLNNFKLKILTKHGQFLLENYFIVAYSKEEGRLIKKFFRGYFRVRNKVNLKVVRNFLKALEADNDFYSCGREVIVPLVHRFYRGVIEEILEDDCYRVKYTFPVNSSRDYCVVVNKFDILIPYSTYKEQGEVNKC